MRKFNPPPRDFRRRLIKFKGNVCRLATIYKVTPKTIYAYMRRYNILTSRMSYTTSYEKMKSEIMSGNEKK